MWRMLCAFFLIILWFLNACVDRVLYAELPSGYEPRAALSKLKIPCNSDSGAVRNGEDGRWFPLVGVAEGTVVGVAKEGEGEDSRLSLGRLPFVFILQEKERLCWNLQSSDKKVGKTRFKPWLYFKLKTA